VDPVLLIFVLLAAALVLGALELFVPSHGVLTILAVAAVASAVAAAWSVNRWAGLGLLFAATAAAPFVVTAGVRLWQRTPIARRMVLTAASAAVEVDAVRVGEIGRCVSALRPMGEAEFGARTVQVLCDAGPLPAGAAVEVVASRSDGVAVVRPTTIDPDARLS